MSTTRTTAQLIPDADRHDDSVGDSRKVAWYARRDGELVPPEDTPVHVGEVYELVSVILRDAPFDFGLGGPTERCIVEATNQRAWPGFAELVLRIFDQADLHGEARSC